jgi:hypothetical protein
MGSCVALSSWFFLYAPIRSVIAVFAEILSRNFRRGYFWVAFVLWVLHACGLIVVSRAEGRLAIEITTGLCMRLTC